MRKLKIAALIYLMIAVALAAYVGLIEPDPQWSPWQRVLFPIGIGVTWPMTAANLGIVMVFCVWLGNSCS